MKRFTPVKKLLFFLSFLGVFSISNSAHAAGGFLSLDNIGASVVGWIFYQISYLAGLVTGVLVALGTALAGYFLDLNQTILQDRFVQVGWTTLRDLANLGFVFVIIVIALATIVRYKEYGVQKLLPRLIAAAILINFSLSIAGVVIDFSNTATRFFLSRVGNGNPHEFASSIAGTLNPQAFLAAQEEPTLPTDQPGILETMLSGILDLVFTIIFSLVIALAMFAFAFMFLARYLILAFLLVVLPIVILFSVIPFLKGMWSKWVDHFIRWVFFAPAAAFFMYLAILTSTAYRNGVEGAGLTSIANMSSSLQNIIRNGMTGVILVGLIIGGLIVAQKMGIAGAKGAIDIAQGARKKTATWAKRTGTRWTKQGATRALRGERGRVVTAGLQRFGQGRNAFVRTLARPVRSLGTALTGARISAEKLVADEAKKLPASLNQQALQYSTASNPARVAILSNVAEEYKKRKDVQKQVEQQIKDMATGKNWDEVDKEALKKLQDRLRGQTELVYEFDEKVLQQLPQFARDQFEAAAGDITGIKLTQLYGKRKGEVMPSKGAISKQVEELIEKAAEEKTAQAKAQSQATPQPSGGGTQPSAGGEQKTT